MKTGWKWSLGIAIGASLCLLLWWRLDTADLRQRAVDRLQQVLHMPVTVGEAELILTHGLSLRLHQISFGRAASWRLQAQWADIDFSLAALLLGQLQVNGVYAMAVQVHVPAATTWAFPKLDVGLHVDRLQLRNVSLHLGDDRLALRDGLLDVRDLGGNDKLRWEINARMAEGDMQSQGQAVLVEGLAKTAFGKVKVAQAPIPAMLDAYLPAGFPYRRMSTALTFELAAGGHLQVFGDVNLPPPSSALPAIAVRGKLAAQLPHGDVSWHDGIAHIGTTAIASEGTCSNGNCQIELHTKVAKLPDLAAVWPRLMPARGRFDADLRLHWRSRRWSLDGDVHGDKLAWQAVNLPAVDAALQGLSGNGRSIGALTQATLTQKGKNGAIILTGFHFGERQWRGDIGLERVQDWWVDAAAAALGLSGYPANLKADGVVRGDLHIDHNQEETNIAFDVDAEQAAFDLTQMLAKPKGVAAAARGRWHKSGERQALVLEHLKLADAAITGLDWRQQGGRYDVAVASMAVDFSQLRDAGIRLPPDWQSVHGGMRGSLGFSYTGGDERGWLATTHGRLQLNGWGMGQHDLSGSIKIERGLARSSKLSWQYGESHAELGGALHLVQLAGEVNVDHGVMGWPPAASLPAWLMPQYIHGRIRDTSIHLFGQDLTEVNARYALRQRQAHFDRLRALWHGGRLAGKGVRLDLGANSVKLAGRLQLGGADLDRVTGERLLGSGLEGRIFATMQISGDIPFKDWRSYAGNGDITIYGGTWYGGDFDRAMAGEGGALPAGETHFSRLDMRFRLEEGKLSIPRLSLHTRHWRLAGQVTLHADARLAGRLEALPATATAQVQGAGLRLGGLWPELRLVRQP